MLYPWPDSSVVRASGISPEGPGFNPQSGHFGISGLYNLNNSHTSTSTPPQSTADPYAMDISAMRNGNGKTREEFISRMRGRCYSCRAQTHEKRNCPHKETTCQYCSHKGHLEAVCQDRFMGLERNRGKKQSNR